MPSVNSQSWVLSFVLPKHDRILALVTLSVSLPRAYGGNFTKKERCLPGSQPAFQRKACITRATLASLCVDRIAVNRDIEPNVLGAIFRNVYDLAGQFTPLALRFTHGSVLLAFQDNYAVGRDGNFGYIASLIALARTFRIAS